MALRLASDYRILPGIHLDMAPDIRLAFLRRSRILPADLPKIAAAEGRPIASLADASVPESAGHSPTVLDSAPESAPARTG